MAHYADHRMDPIADHQHGVYGTKVLLPPPASCLCWPNQDERMNRTSLPGSGRSQDRLAGAQAGQNPRQQGGEDRGRQLPRLAEAGDRTGESVNGPGRLGSRSPAESGRYWHPGRERWGPAGGTADRLAGEGPAEGKTIRLVSTCGGRKLMACSAGADWGLRDSVPLGGEIRNKTRADHPNHAWSSMCGGR